MTQEQNNTLLLSNFIFCYYMANLQSDALSYAKKRTAYRSVYYLVSAGRLVSAPTPLHSLHTVFPPHPHPAT